MKYFRISAGAQDLSPVMLAKNRQSLSCGVTEMSAL